MALINCPECSREISDTVKVCPGCGYKLAKKKKHIFFKTQKQKRIVVIALAIFVVLLLVTGGTLGYKYYFVPLGNYNAAIALVDSKKFDDAIEEFNKLNEFKDSKEKVLQTHYKKAEYLLESNLYEKAVAEFEAAGEYKDAVDRVNATKYLWAENTSINQAIILYKELGDYKDSKDKFVAAKKKQAEKIAIGKLISANAKCISDGTKIASDNKSIQVDSFGKYDFSSLSDVQTIIESLDLPDSLYDEMCATNALMGRQSDTYDGFEISWSYHPDNGLDVIFKYKGQ